MNHLSVVNSETGESQSFINYLDSIAKSDLIFDLAIKDRCSLYKQIQQIESALRIIKQYVQLSLDSEFNEDQTKIKLDNITISKVKGKMKESEYNTEEHLREFLLKCGYDEDSDTLEAIELKDIGRYKFELQWSKVKKLISLGYTELKRLFYQNKDYFKIETTKDNDIPTPL